MARGASAARIVIGDDVVAKLDTVRTGSRVRRQGIWLYDYAHPTLPSVIRVTSQGYEMKRYVDVPLEEFVDDPMPLLAQVWKVYRKMVSPIETRQREWVRNPYVALDPIALDTYVVDLCRQVGAPTIAFRLLELRRSITWPTQLTWTHGDLIADNVMRDARGAVILIDAIPPCGALPSLAVVDFGRLVQSAAGYEQMRYAETTPKDDVWQDRVSTILNWVAAEPYYNFGGFDEDAIHATLFYAIVHMLRGARTARERIQQEKMVDQARNLLEELDTWTR
jgi:hypothetical protein